MKRLVPTLILVLVCIGGFWYASSHSLFKDKSAADPAIKLFTLQSADIQAIQLKAAATPDPNATAAAPAASAITELSKKGADWQMIQPSALPVNHFSVDSWNDAFTGLTYDGKIDDASTNLTDFGLADATQYFQITLKDGSVKKLLVGNAMPVAGHVYAKLADAPTVYELTDQSVQSISKQPLDFIDKNAVKFNYDKVKSLQVEWKGAKWLLEKAQADKTVNESTWKLDGKDRKPEEGTAILDKVTALATEQMPKAASEVKLDTPELKITVIESDAGKDTSTTFVGKIDKDNVWIAQQGGVWAYSVPTTSIQALFDASKPPEPAAPTSPASTP
jgi:hypothetical protein